MNFNIYIDNKTGKEIISISQLTGKSKNTIIREAIQEWVAHHQIQKWPEIILEFKGVKNLKRFESYRKELLAPKAEFLS